MKRKKKIYMKYMDKNRLDKFDKNVVKELEKRFNIKVRGMDVKKEVSIWVEDPIDQTEIENFRLIDNIIDFLEKTYDGTAIHNWDEFTVNQL